MSAVRRLWDRFRVRFVAPRMYEARGRDKSQRPDEVLAALGLRAGDRIADLGSGTGYFTLRFARAVGADGVVLAVDTDAPLLDALVVRARAAGLDNVRPVTPAGDDAALPEPVDLVFLAHVYHHLPGRAGYFRRLAGSLRQGGRVAIVEALPGGFFGRLFGSHWSVPSGVRSEMESAGYRIIAAHNFLEGDSFQVFEPIPAAGVESAAG